jgi:surface polysaccharide O-acyltransferase-like enzyme
VALFRAAWQKSSLTVRQSDGLTEKLSRKIAPTTFGIYLVHVAVLICLREVATSHGHHSPFLVNVLVGTALAFGLSYAITLLMQKIPGLKRLV